MVSTFFPFTSLPLHKFYSTSTFIYHTKMPHVGPINHYQHFFKPLNISAFGFHHKKPTRLKLPLASKGSNNEDNRAMETVLKLYEAIKNKNLIDISEIIGHDCLCVCNHVTFHGKKQVMEFFSSLMDNMRNKFEFVVQPTLHDGMTVGVHWKLECSKVHKPIGTGFSFYTCHIYEGNVLIRNVEIFLEPFLHIEPTTLRMIGVIASIVGLLASHAIINDEKKKVFYVLCTLITFVMLCIVVRIYKN